MNRENKYPNPNKPAGPALQKTQDAIWDFERNETGRGFTFTRRDPSQNYRIIGSAPTRPLRATAVAGRARAATNRFNSSVKMLPGDVTAPWEDNFGGQIQKMPIVGEVAAGRFDVTVAYHQPGYDAEADYIFVNSDEVKNGRSTFALRVRGSSMIEADIEDGDVIIVQAQNWAEEGDFVIACLTDSSDVNGFVTLKRFYRHKQADRIVLQPANPSLSPIHILPHKGDARTEDLDGVKIQGRVVAVIKTNLN